MVPSGKSAGFTPTREGLPLPQPPAPHPENSPFPPPPQPGFALPNVPIKIYAEGEAEEFIERVIRVGESEMLDRAPGRIWNPEYIPTQKDLDEENDAMQARIDGNR